jgi:hypothetical protein
MMHTTTTAFATADRHQPELGDVAQTLNAAGVMEGATLVVLLHKAPAEAAPAEAQPAYAWPELPAEEEEEVEVEPEPKAEEGRDVAKERGDGGPTVLPPAPSEPAAEVLAPTSSLAPTFSGFNAGEAGMMSLQVRARAAAARRPRPVVFHVRPRCALGRTAGARPVRSARLGTPHNPHCPRVLSPTPLPPPAQDEGFLRAMLGDAAGVDVEAALAALQAGPAPAPSPSPALRCAAPAALGAPPALAPSAQVSPHTYIKHFNSCL